MVKELHDNVSRVKRTNLLGSTVFVGLRAADVFLQHALLHKSWAVQILTFLGGRAVSSSWLIEARSGKLSPYHSIVTWMAVGSSLKQIITVLVVTEQEVSPSSGFTIALFNTIFNSLNSILSIWAFTSLARPPSSLLETIQNPLIGFSVGAYLVGILTEMTSELQRTWFKKDPGNKGKPYAGGLFSLARHINYGGYTIWRAAYALLSGGWVWGLVVGTFFFTDFVNRGVPVLDQYLSQRYGEQWEAIKARVPYRLIPGVY